MYHKLQDFYTDWAYETERTLKYIEGLQNEALNLKPHADVRAIKQLVFHITATVPEMMSRTGLHLTEIDYEQEAPEDTTILHELFAKTANEFVSVVQTQWNDDTLQTTDEMYGEIWRRGDSLKYLILHQAHHRGQLSILMRQAGLKSVGVYGPSHEEWVTMGATPMK